MTALSALPMVSVAALLALSVLACMFAVPPLGASESSDAIDDSVDAETMHLQELMIG